MKKALKYAISLMLFLPLFALFVSCSQSSNGSGGGGGGGSTASDNSEPVLLSTWLCSYTFTSNGTSYTNDYYYYLYSDNKLAYKIVATVTSSAYTQALYRGTWEDYAGDHGHTYHFNYDLSSDSSADVWADLSSSATTMTIYSTENKTMLDNSGNTVSSQVPTSIHYFTKQ